MKQKEAIEMFANAAFLTRQAARLLDNKLTSIPYESYVEKMNGVIAASRNAAKLENEPWYGSLFFLTSKGLVFDAIYETINRQQDGVVVVILHVDEDGSRIDWKNPKIKNHIANLMKLRNDVDNLKTTARLLNA